MNVAVSTVSEASAQALLSVEGLTTEILTPAGPRSLAQDVSFAVRPRELLAVVGESGSGKSITMLSVLGLLPEPVAVTAGHVVFEGQDLLALRPDDLRRIRGDRIGMIFQEPMSALNPVLSVGAQIAETLTVHRGLGRGAARAEAVRLLDRVRIPNAADRARLYPHQLSGGMRQRVVIAAAIACKPALLIADEPTTALDTTVQAEIVRLLAELRNDVGCAVVLITHDMGLVRDVADTVVVMSGGRVLEHGSREAVLTQPREAYTRTLIAASLPATAAPHPPSAPSKPVLDVRDLIVSFPLRSGVFSGRRGHRLFAVDGVSFSVSPGETLALVGESGSGKTTIARALLGLAAIDAGGVWIGAKDVRASARGRGTVQFVFQDPQASLDPRIRAWQSVIEPLVLAGEKDNSRLRVDATRLFADVGLGPGHLDRFPHELSGGQRQRLGIARALSVGPRVLIADEAVSALDASTRLQVLDLLAELQRRTSVAILFITHDFGVVSRLAHRVAVMRFGRILEIGRTAAVLGNPRHPYTQALLAAVPGNAGGVTSPPPPIPPGAHRSAPAGTPTPWHPLQMVAEDHAVACEPLPTASSANVC